ncbi:ABC transporter permease [Pseudonocardia sp.]|jgi:ABC-2 type transport system permease protein|uniref:ABC transporter permease n=1 Tax=Pseudonocardia sp. TaxID=60912 RepID=UPI0031FDFAEC
MTTTAPAPVTQIRVPIRSAGSELRAVKIVWQRELLRFANDRLRIITTLVQPFLFLFVLGSGLSSLTHGSTDGLNLRTFLYPGVLAMAVMFTAMASAGSIVWDREFGFLREMLVAPVRRSSLVIGKCLGGATVATSQGVVVLAIAGLAGVPYDPALIAAAFGMQLLLAFTITAFGVMMAARIKQMQSFMALTQMLLMPLYFLSGSLFPASNLPTWLTVLNRIDPLTYIVDPLRRLIFAHLDLSPAVRASLSPGVTWNGWRVPAGVEIGIVALIGVVMLAIAIGEFNETE